MKKIILISVIALLGITQMVAQEYEYVPFVREGVKWVYSYTNVDEIDEVMNRPADPNLAYGTVYLTLELKGDTVINGKTYKAMHKYYGNAINTDNDTIPIYLREENKVVYGIVPDGKTYLDCPIGRPLYGNSTMQQRIISGEEFVLYDFQDPETFWKSFFFKEDEYECVFAFSDVIQVGNHLAKRYVFEGAEDYVIEGIGVDNLYYGYTLFPFKPIFLGSGDVKFKLRYVVEAGEIVYKGVNYEGPKPDQDDYEYVPFVREGVKWVYSYTNVDMIDEVMDRPADPNLAYGTVYLTLELKGDTVINGKTYKAMHKYYGDAINTVNDTIPVYLREEDKVVYGIVPDGKTYADCPIGRFIHSLKNYIINGEEFVLYDFQDPVTFWNDVFYWDEETWEEESVIASSEIIQVGNHLAKKYVFLEGADYVIEGIGADCLGSGYTLFPFMPRWAGSGDVKFKLRYVVEDGEIVYKGVNYEGEKPAQDYEYIPYIAPGVKFINEKVIVNNGDTTSYYYTYEMTPDVICESDGIDTYYHDVMWCHYYTGSEIDEFNDSIICGVYLIHPGFFNVFKNEAFNKIEDEGRNLIIMPGMMDGAFRELYDPLYSYNSFAEWTTAFYIGYQPDNYLTSDNFYEVEPTVVDGHPMQRFAHISEQGDTLGYIVQGIGFDSYDMGDLLTPFTRKPDPDADYQEWCGLSHVVKDGKIIYKGMRYREGAFDGINEVVADKTRRPADPYYYNLMGQPVGTTVPNTPGIYIHQGRKVVVR